jgi:hypothetical protein
MAACESELIVILGAISQKQDLRHHWITVTA